MTTKLTPNEKTLLKSLKLINKILHHYPEFDLLGMYYDHKNQKFIPQIQWTVSPSIILNFDVLLFADNNKFKNSNGFTEEEKNTYTTYIEQIKTYKFKTKNNAMISALKVYKKIEQIFNKNFNQDLNFYIEEINKKRYLNKKRLIHLTIRKNHAYQDIQNNLGEEIIAKINMEKISKEIPHSPSKNNQIKI